MLILAPFFYEHDLIRKVVEHVFHFTLYALEEKVKFQSAAGTSFFCSTGLD